MTEDERAEMRAKLEIADAEEAFVKAKTEHGRDSKQARTAAEKLHKLRDPYRADRDAARAAVADGDAVAAPETIGVTAAAQKG